MKKQILLSTAILLLSFLTVKAQLTTIHTFNGSDGSYSLCELVQNGSYIYGGTTSGGTNDKGVIFKINLDDNSYTKIIDLSSSNGESLSSLLNVGDYIYGTTLFGGTSNEGVLFKISKNDDTFTKIKDFESSTSGRNPTITATDGTYIYGTTQMGGDNNHGTIFKIKINSDTYTKIHDFGTVTGYYPWHSLVSEGNVLYGTTLTGGQNGRGTLFKIDKDGNNFSVLHAFGSNNDGKDLEGTLLISGDYIYGTTQSGGDSNNGTVFKLNKSNTSDYSYSSFNWSNGATPKCGLIEVNNILYGTASQGGADDVGNIFTVTKNNLVITDIYDFDGTDGSDPEAPLVRAGGYLYGTTNIGGDNDKGTVFKYDAGFASVNNIKTNSVTVLPNPATNSINIKFPENNNYNISLLTVSGKEIAKFNAKNSDFYKINIEKLPAGIYFITTQNINSGKTENLKFIKK